MRLLDLGASDGAIAHWLQGQHPDLHVDAVELDPRLAEIADGRITGSCVVAAAEQAPEHFDAGTYDAVTVLEVLEHAIDPDRLLAAAEAMVTPQGRIYVSTPDGTFGAGSNPNHLRCLRAVDLADTLRRRGRLVDMDVGSDGIVTGVYQPRPRLEDIAIYTGPGWEPWHPADIEQRGLGGSETAAVRLAEALSALGFIVTVYGELREDTCWRDVIFRRHERFDPLDARAGLICSRLPEVADRPIAAAVRLLWVHDVDCGDRLTPKRSECFDAVLALSGWHARHLRGRYPFAADKVVETRNGIELSYFEPKPWQDRAQRVLYTSSPDRGLDVLLELWPHIHKRCPDAELVHCYAPVYDRVADQDPVVAAHRDRIRELADQPGVRSVGSMGQRALAGLMCDSRVWAHPSWIGQHSVPFHETSCLGSMEAQAAGCHLVTSGWGALPETVRYGRLVNSDPGGQRWRDALVEHIVEGLTDREVGDAAVEHGPRAAAGLGWEDVAVALGRLIAPHVQRG